MNQKQAARPGFAGALAAVLMFAALARGANDLWSATIVHALTLGWVSGLVIAAHRQTGASLRFPLVYPVGAFAAAALLSTVFAFNRFDAIFAMKDIAAAVLFFYAGVNTFASDEDKDLLLHFAAPVLWIQAVCMVLQIFKIIPNNETEAYGTLVNANIQAAFGLFWVPPFVYRAFERRRGGLSWHVFAAGAVGAVAVVLLAGSTWAILCLVLGLLVAVVRRINRPAVTWAFVAGAVALVAGAAVYKFMRTVPGEWQNMPAPQGGDRLKWWRSAVDMFLAHPLLGVGPGGFANAYFAYKYGVVQNTLYAHSLPLTIAAELGLLGVVTSGVAFVTWLHRVNRRATYRGAFAAGALLALAMCLINVGSEYLVNRLTLALFFGIAVAGLPAAAGEPASGRRPRFSVAVLVPVAAALALPLLVSPFLSSRFLVDGRASLAEGNAAGAEKQFQSAVDLDGTSWEAHLGLARARWAQGAADPDRRALALFDMEHAIRNNRLGVMLWLEDGIMLREAGRLEEARRALLHALAMRPDDARIQEELKKLSER